jgi:cobalamin biosynthesis protein CobW
MEAKLNSRVKVNILTGFFGSGKTTLISNLVKIENIKNKIAIIQNEFSEEMGIEKDTLTDSEGNSLGNLYELPNGCLCCVVKDNVIIFLENLIKQKSALEMVVIESHGISDISLVHNYNYFSY